MRIFWLLPIAFGLVPGCICADSSKEDSSQQAPADPSSAYRGPVRMRLQPDRAISRLRPGALPMLGAASNAPAASASAP